MADELDIELDRPIKLVHVPIGVAFFLGAAPIPFAPIGSFLLAVLLVVLPPSNRRLLQGERLFSVVLAFVLMAASMAAMVLFDENALRFVFLIPVIIGLSVLSEWSARIARKKLKSDFPESGPG